MNFSAAIKLVRNPGEPPTGGGRSSGRSSKRPGSGTSPNCYDALVALDGVAPILHQCYEALVALGGVAP